MLTEKIYRVMMTLSLFSSIEYKANQMHNVVKIARFK